MPAIKYKNAAGKRLQGCTTIKGQQVGWGKNPLMWWANNQGLEGKTLQEAYNTATKPGTFVHYLIEQLLRGNNAELRRVLGRRYKECADLIQEFSSMGKEF